MKFLVDIAYCSLRLIPELSIVADIIGRIEQRYERSNHCERLDSLQADVVAIKALVDRLRSERRDHDPPGKMTTERGNHLVVLPGALDPLRANEAERIVAARATHVGDRSASMGESGVTFLFDTGTPRAYEADIAVTAEVLAKCGRAIPTPHVIVEDESIVIAVRPPRRLDGANPAMFRRIMLDERRAWGGVRDEAK